MIFISNKLQSNSTWKIEIYHSEAKSFCIILLCITSECRIASTHSNQQLATQLKHTFAPNHSVTVKSLILKFFLALLHIMYTSICRNLNCFRHKKYTLECRIFNSSPLFKISLHAALLNTLHYAYNTPEHRRNTFLALYIRCKDERSAFEIWQAPEHHPVSLPVFMQQQPLCTTSTIIAYVNNWHLYAFHSFLTSSS